ncbi:hypothetical protein C8Q72DRAFT_950315 [Fomitopsis betulina]|nr:hypothetical protein C8Q72DRAFT_950315 [Fomitopsis betulina]
MEPGQSTTKASGLCRFCGAQASLRCSRCKDVFYCGKDHSASDWKRHKRLCVAAQGVEPRSIMIDAILFPVDATEPRMIKLACKVERDLDPDIPSFDIIHTLAMGAYFPLEPKDIRTFTPGGGTVLVSKPGYQLNLYADDCSLINGSHVNLCVQVLTRGTAPHPWSGNIIGVRSERPLSYCGRFYNASMQEDLARLVDVFVRYGTESYRNEREAVAKWGGRVKELEY